MNALGFNVQQKLWIALAWGAVLGSACGSESSMNSEPADATPASNRDVATAADGAGRGAPAPRRSRMAGGAGAAGGEREPDAGSGDRAARGGKSARASSDTGSGGAADAAGSAAGAAGVPAAGSGGSGSGASEPEAGSGSDASDPGDGGARPVDPPSQPTYLNDADRSENVEISSDRLSAEWLYLGTGGVRSTRSIAPHQGVFYFEASALGHFDSLQIGVATADAPLDHGAGATDDGFGLDTGGYFIDSGNATPFSSSSDIYGFVLDYRGDQPIVHVLGEQAGSPALLRTQSLSLSQPVFIHLSGIRRMAGDQVTINPGNDTVNRPFRYDPQALLTSAGQGETASALVRGWGATHAGTFNQPPTITLTMQSSSSVAAGESVTLHASADDAEDHSLTASIRWELVSAGPGAVVGMGESFSPTLSALGQHPIRFSVTDSGGKTVSEQVTIQATGTLQQFSDVRLEDEPGLSGTGITLRSDGRAAKWSVDQKFGVRANQGLYGGFWYVEGHRLIAEANQAIGLVIGGVPLNPYAFNTTPPSCSVNTVGPSVYQNLILVSQEMAPSTDYYGLAVDYRGDHPIVHVIMDGAVHETLELRDATVPIYPMLYGNVTNESGAYDMEINFGPSFHEDPRQALMDGGIDPSGLRLCWGTSNGDC